MTKTSQVSTYLRVTAIMIVIVAVRRQTRGQSTLLVQKMCLLDSRIGYMISKLMKRRLNKKL